MLSKELWLVQVNHATVKLDSNVKWKQNWTANSRSQVSLLPSYQNSPVSRKVWTKLWILQELQKYVRITSPFARFSMKVALATVQFCVLCGWWFSNQFDILPATPHSWRYSWQWTMRSYSLLAVVPLNGLRHSRRKAKLCVYLNCLGKWCFIPDNYFETEKIWSRVKYYLNSQNFPPFKTQRKKLCIETSCGRLSSNRSCERTNQNAIIIKLLGNLFICTCFAYFTSEPGLFYSLKYIILTLAACTVWIGTFWKLLNMEGIWIVKASF